MLPEVNTKGMSLMPRPLSNIERDETVDLVATVWKKKKECGCFRGYYVYVVFFEDSNLISRFNFPISE